MPPVLYIVVPCFNEESVLPITAPILLKKLDFLSSAGKISAESRILFVNDGSRDSTWEIISALAAQNGHYRGISLSRNRGHQNALLAGLMEARPLCDITVSIDCDGQDDINAIDAMIDEYLCGCDIVYGVRADRSSDSFFKRSTAHGFYRLLAAMGAEVVYDHADYRLISSRALDALAQFGEVNLFLRGMVPLVGFKSACVSYSRAERLAGESHYPLGKMLALAADGITSLSVKPLRLISALGGAVSALSLIAFILVLCLHAQGWAIGTAVICFVLGLQLIALGVVGEYTGKIYAEAKHRPRYIISERTQDGR